MTAVTAEAPPDYRAIWHRLRFPLVLLAVLVGAAIVLAVFADNPAQRPLDPGDASPHGGLALSRLVRAQGTTVTAVASAAGMDTSGATVFVPDPGSVSGLDLSRYAESGDVVVVGPDERALRALQVPAEPDVGGLTATLEPRCGFDMANRAGDIHFDGQLYVDRTDTTCYPTAGAAALLIHRSPAGAVVVVGSSSMFTNAALDQRGDAALGIGLLTQHPRLIWLLPQAPSQRAPDTTSKGLLDLLPARLLWAVAQLAICVLVVALWRARRLGPVVAEPLPVVVRAVETVEGRARLMRAARARSDAADSLRVATRSRLGDLLAIGVDAPAAALVEAVTVRTGRSVDEVRSLLFGSAPPDDKTLVVLANALDDLESAVRHT